MSSEPDSFLDTFESVAPSEVADAARKIDDALFSDDDRAWFAERQAEREAKGYCADWPLRARLRGRWRHMNEPYEHDLAPKVLRNPIYILTVFLLAHFALAAWAYWELFS